MKAPKIITDGIFSLLHEFGIKSYLCREKVENQFCKMLAEFAELPFDERKGFHAEWDVQRGKKQVGFSYIYTYALRLTWEIMLNPITGMGTPTQSQVNQLAHRLRKDGVSKSWGDALKAARIAIETTYVNPIPDLERAYRAAAAGQMQAVESMYKTFLTGPNGELHRFKPNKKAALLILQLTVSFFNIINNSGYEQETEAKAGETLVFLSA